MPDAVGVTSRKGGLASISVVIPTCNRSRLLVQTLESYRHHAGELDLELVVVDDGSRDDTAERLSELKRSTPNLVWRSVPNRGPGLARNVGAALASRDVVLFVGDDIQPENEDFLRIHAELHARHRERNLAVLGKVVWPNRPDGDVNFVMAHVQGKGGEQFGYADLYPFSFLDWRFFYTANVSVKRDLVGDWISEGFSSEFPLAAYEDAEFAYRMTLRDPPLRIFYTPASVGVHLHPFTVSEFMNRQVAAGMMGRVFADLHPGIHVRNMIGLGGVHHAICQPVNPDQERAVADQLSVVEGIKSWVRLIESQLQLGSQHWHDDLLRAVFHLCYLTGFVLNWSRPDGNLAGAYRFAIDEFLLYMNRALHTELAGAALGQRRDVSSALSLRSEEIVSRSRLRRWARGRPWIAGPYRSLRGWLRALSAR
jgi:glycosyltransferase involved in cell wall biosynthesis